MIDRLRLIEMMDGDAAIADKFIFEFKRISREQIQSMQKYLADKNWPMLSNSAHVMKTQAGYMGLENIEQTSGKIEELVSGSSHVDLENVRLLVHLLVRRVL